MTYKTALLFLVSVSVFAMSVQQGDQDSQAYQIGKRIIATLDHITSDPGYPDNFGSMDVLAKANAEVLEILQKSSVRSANEEARFDMRALDDAFMELMKTAGVTPTKVMEIMQSDPTFMEVQQKLESLRGMQLQKR